MGRQEVLSRVDEALREGAPEVPALRPCQALAPRPSLRTPSPAEEAFTPRSGGKDGDGHPALIADALDRLACGIAILDIHGRLMTCNAMAQSIFERGDSLYLLHEHLCARLAVESRRLHLLLESVIAVGRQAGGAMLIHGPTQRTYGVSVEATDVDGRRRTGAAARVYITDVGARPCAAHESRLRAMFGFTAAEARIAVGVADGDAVQKVAERAGVSYESARFTLKRVYEKAGVHKQAELAALLRSALPPLCGHDPAPGR